MKINILQNVSRMFPLTLVLMLGACELPPDMMLAFQEHPPVADETRLDRERLIAVLIDEADLAVQRGQPAAAIDHYQSILRIDPRNERAIAGLARAQYTTVSEYQVGGELTVLEEGELEPLPLFDDETKVARKQKPKPDDATDPSAKPTADNDAKAADAGEALDPETILDEAIDDTPPPIGDAFTAVGGTQDEDAADDPDKKADENDDRLSDVDPEIASEVNAVLESLYGGETPNK